MSSKTLFLLSALLWSSILMGQHASGMHYTVRDGLPSSTIYSIVQDERRFIWIGTEAGLARFDGDRFEVFTTHDGLPDNEVLGLIYDTLSRRLWITTYSREVCYYYEGQFYTCQTDSSLCDLRSEIGQFLSFCPQADGCMLMTNGYEIFRYRHGKTIEAINLPHNIDVRNIRERSDSVLEMITGVNGMRRLSDGRDSIYPLFCCDTSVGRGKWIGDKCFIFRKGKIDIYGGALTGHYFHRGSITTGTQQNVTNILLRGEAYIFSIYNTGVYTCDTDLSTMPKLLWSGPCNVANIDDDGNIWIATADDGIYVLRNGAVENPTLENTLKTHNLTALCLVAPGKLYVGTSEAEVFLWRHGVAGPAIRALPGDMLIRAMAGYSGGLFVISNALMYHMQPPHPPLIIPHWGDQSGARHKYWAGGAKCLMSSRDGHRVYVGLLSCIGIYDVASSHYQEYWNSGRRILCMAEHPDGTIYCGSIDGIYTLRDTLLYKVPVDQGFSRRVTSICFTPDSLLWIGTPSNGIFICHGPHILAHLDGYMDTRYRGAICRRVVPGRKGEVWIATNAGVNKVVYRYGPAFSIQDVVSISTLDGMINDDVNDIAYGDSLLYVATAAGLSVIREHSVASTIDVPVYITSVSINGREKGVSGVQYDLSYDQNNILIEYVGVLLPSARGLRYAYRLLGSGSDRWTITTNRSVDFRSLSPGQYTFEVSALDKFGHRYPMGANISFRITPAFYITVWFWAIIMVAILVAGFLIIRDRFRRQQERFRKEQSLHNKIIELEQQALKAQMNPHFIFNCLTAVQHFVNKEDLYSANMYLSNFARLIRKTLDLSGEQYVSLDTEIAYLKDYIQMECLRFGDKFTWEIAVAAEVDTFDAQIPPMLLQPIVENAIRHGLRNLENKKGKLIIGFEMRESTLLCTVDDNGIGRKKADELKTTMHVEYQSKGMALTEMRIQAINQISDNKIRIEVKDKYDRNNQPDGTLFILAVRQS